MLLPPPTTTTTTTTTTTETKPSPLTLAPPILPNPPLPPPLLLLLPCLQVPCLRRARGNDSVSAEDSREDPLLRLLGKVFYFGTEEICGAGLTRFCPCDRARLMAVRSGFVKKFALCNISRSLSHTTAARRRGVHEARRSAARAPSSRATRPSSCRCRSSAPAATRHLPAVEVLHALRGLPRAGASRARSSARTASAGVGGGRWRRQSARSRRSRPLALLLSRTPSAGRRGLACAPQVRLRAGAPRARSAGGASSFGKRGRIAVAPTERTQQLLESARPRALARLRALAARSRRARLGSSKRGAGGPRARGLRRGLRHGLRSSMRRGLRHGRSDQRNLYARASSPRSHNAEAAAALRPPSVGFRKKSRQQTKKK